MGSIKFGMVGGGWRAEFYLRIAHVLRKRFEITGMVIRKPEKAKAMNQRWHVNTFGTVEQMLAVTKPQFVVSSVPWKANPEIIKDLVTRGIPVLSETPPAADIEALRDLYAFVSERGGRVQVAEQYHLQPNHRVRLALAAGGKLGTVSQVTVSAAHGYHGISLIRRFLGVLFENATVHAFKFDSSLVKGPGRDGPPKEEALMTSSRSFSRFEYPGKLGLFDFAGGQYFSWVRSDRLLVRGERGEIMNDRVFYLKDYLTPIELDLVRHVAGAGGNLEGKHLKGIQVGDEWVYRNPFAPASMSDDEIAVAGCLVGMDEYVRTGVDFYSLAEACQDHYLSIVAQEALGKGEPVETSTQPWAK